MSNIRLQNSKSDEDECCQRHDRNIDSNLPASASGHRSLWESRKPCTLFISRSPGRSRNSGRGVDLQPSTVSTACCGFVQPMYVSVDWAVSPAAGQLLLTLQLLSMLHIY